MDNILEQIKKYVLEAGEIVLNADYNDLQVNTKEGISNFVTKYDKEIQIYLKERLLNLVEGSTFIGEEMDDQDTKESLYKFVVDPIDGTNNFSRHMSESAISVALLKNNEPYMAVCYKPYSKELFSAKKGEGAYLNGKPIHVSNRPLANGIVFCGSSPYYEELREKTLETQNAIIREVGEFRRYGSAVIEACYVAAGKAELFYEYRLQLWDYAAAALILTEAGGILTTTDGSPVKFEGPSSVVCANNMENYNLFMSINKK